MLCILAFLILLVGASITLIVIYQRKNDVKHSSAIPIHNINEVSDTNACTMEVECIEVNTNQAYVATNNIILSEPNVAYIWCSPKWV